uniref:Cytokine receptor common subunit beta N-terminal domain-containing protein n=1 Tax=Zosterops lateralis melanops TaxID=1220523 RepID=A0A8D2QQG3_ZOSLA
TATHKEEMTTICLLTMVSINPWKYSVFENIPMKSLKCYNDYNSQVTCTWMEHSEAHDLVGMVLYQRDNIKM